MKRAIMILAIIFGLGGLSLSAQATGTDHPDCPRRIEIEVDGPSYTIPAGNWDSVWSKAGDNDHRQQPTSGTITSGEFNHKGEEKDISHVDLCPGEDPTTTEIVTTTEVTTPPTGTGTPPSTLFPPTTPETTVPETTVPPETKQPTTVPETTDPATTTPETQPPTTDPPRTGLAVTETCRRLLWEVANGAGRQVTLIIEKDDGTVDMRTVVIGSDTHRDSYRWLPEDAGFVLTIGNARSDGSAPRCGASSTSSPTTGPVTTGSLLPATGPNDDLAATLAILAAVFVIVGATMVWRAKRQ